MRCVVCRLPQQNAAARHSQQAAHVRHGQHLRASCPTVEGVACGYAAPACILLAVIPHHAAALAQVWVCAFCSTKRLCAVCALPCALGLRAIEHMSVAHRLILPKMRHRNADSKHVTGHDTMRARGRAAEPAPEALAAAGSFVRRRHDSCRRHGYTLRCMLSVGSAGYIGNALPGLYAWQHRRPIANGKA